MRALLCCLAVGPPLCRGRLRDFGAAGRLEARSSFGGPMMKKWRRIPEGSRR